VQSAGDVLKGLFEGQAKREAMDRETARQAMKSGAEMSMDINQRRGLSQQTALSNMIAALRSSMIRR
jgi:hypothetical protein